MPKITDSQLQDIIREGDRLVVTLDTSALRKFAYRFADRPLASLAQLKEHNVDVWISEVVAREVMDHLVNDAKDASKALHSAQLEYSKKWRVAGREKKYDEALDSEKAEKKFSEEWNSFVDAIGASTISSATVKSMDLLLDRYFGRKPPFGSGRKKDEFPDAIALMSIETLATKADVWVLVVSTDPDWAEYCHHSARMIACDDLPGVLDMFNRSDRKVAVQLQGHIDRAHGDVYDKIFDAIRSALDDATFYAEANSQFIVECEPQTVKLVDIEGTEGISVVESSDDKVSLHFLALLHCSFSASMSFSHYDSIDKDEVPMGSSFATTEDSISAGVTVTLGKKSADADFNAAEVSVSWPDPTIDFGDVEPDWRADYEPE